MAREFIRPEVGERLLAELVPPHVRVLINPTWDDLKEALASLQHRARKNCLPAESLKRLLESSRQPEFFSEATTSALRAPLAYGYDYPSTQAAACNLGNGLVGFLLTRTRTPPGDVIPLPLYPHRPSDAAFDPQDWLNSVSMAFWTRLTDEEINRLERMAIEQAIVIAARLREEADQRNQRQAANPGDIQRAQERARLQLESLFMGVRPTYTTHLSQACRGIADTVGREGRDSVTWREFKQRWASVADRYRDDLLPSMTNGMITVKNLLGMQGERLFTLSFGLWRGSQRLFDSPQLVFRVEARDLLVNLAKSDNATGNVVARIKRLNALSMSCHPTLQWTAGWLRVHIDDNNRLVFVDEIQSDTLERLRVVKANNPQSSEVANALRPWNLHGFASVCRWAHAIGYSVGTHSESLRDYKPGMTKSPRKWNEYYAPVIKLFDLRPETVAGYPGPIMTNRHHTPLQLPGDAITAAGAPEPRIMTA